MGRRVSLRGFGHYAWKALFFLFGALRTFYALIRGIIYIMYYRLFRRNVRIRFPFRAFSRVSIVGPGFVLIDRNCSVFNNVFRGLTIVTLDQDAQVAIGRECSLGGLTIRCRKFVKIGDRTMTAASLVQDGLFVNTQVIDKCMENKFPFSGVRGVEIGKNVWLCGHCIVLNGCRIEDDCVLAAGSVCLAMELKSYRLTGGNPANMSLSINQILRLKGDK